MRDPVQVRYGVALTASGMLCVQRAKSRLGTQRHVFLCRESAIDQLGIQRFQLSLDDSTIPIQSSVSVWVKQRKMAWMQLGGRGEMVLALPSPWVRCAGLKLEPPCRRYEVDLYIRSNLAYWAETLRCNICALQFRVWRLPGSTQHYLLLFSHRDQLQLWQRACDQAELPLLAIESGVFANWRARQYWFQHTTGECIGHSWWQQHLKTLGWDEKSDGGWRNFSSTASIASTRAETEWELDWLPRLGVPVSMASTTSSCERQSNELDLDSIYTAMGAALWGYE